MNKTDRTAGFFIAIAGIYYAWNSFMTPIRADEAFLYLKSTGSSWGSISFTGLIEYILLIMNFLGDSVLNLRLPSIIFISLSMVIIFNLVYKISGRLGAWFSMMLFFVSLPVSYAYVSMTPNALYIFAAAVYIYSLYFIITEKNNHIKYYIWNTLSLIVIISTSVSGVIFVIFPFIYLIFQKELLKNKNFIILISAGILYFIIFWVLSYFGLFELTNKYPFYETALLYYYILLIITFLPLFYVIMVIVLQRQKEDKSFFLIISALFFGLTCITASIIMQWDIRNMGAFLIPSFILAGYFYEKYNYNLLLGIIIVVTVLFSAYTSIAPHSKLTPKNMEYAKIYELNRFSMQELVTLGDKLFSKDTGFSSILAYNILIRPEACTIDHCSGDRGVYISTTKEDDMLSYFKEVKESKIYRLFSKKDGTLQLYLYNVKGIKDKKQ